MEAVPPVNTLERRGSNTLCLLRAVYTLTVVALIIQFIAMMTPWWMVVSLPELKISLNIGLFWVSGCYSGKCKTVTYDELEEQHSDYNDDTLLVEGRTEVVLALVFGVIAFIILLTSVRRNPLERRTNNVMTVAVMLLISGVLMLVAGGRFITATSIASGLLTSMHESNVYGVPNSAVLACVGGSLSCIASVMTMAVAYQRNNQPNVYQEFNPGQLQPGVVMTAPAPPGYYQPTGYPVPMMPPQGFPQPAGNPVQTGMLPDPRASGYGYDQPKY